MVNPPKIIPTYSFSTLHRNKIKPKHMYEVSFVSLSCIVQTLWQCQAIIEEIVPIGHFD